MKYNDNAVRAYKISHIFLCLQSLLFSYSSLVSSRPFLRIMLKLPNTSMSFFSFCCLFYHKGSDDGTWGTFEVSAFSRRREDAATACHSRWEGRNQTEAEAVFYFRWDISVICAVIEFKFTVTVTSLLFRTLWPNWLNCVRSFQKYFGLWPKNKQDGGASTS